MPGTSEALLNQPLPSGIPLLWRAQSQRHGCALNGSALYFARQRTPGTYQALARPWGAVMNETDTSLGSVGHITWQIDTE